MTTSTKPLPRTLSALNRRFRADGMPIELVRGDGYLYFVWEDGDPNHYESRSIYTPRFSDQSPERWMEDARSFYEDHSKVLSDRASAEAGGEFPISLSSGEAVVSYGDR